MSAIYVCQTFIVKLEHQIKSNVILKIWTKTTMFLTHWTMTGKSMKGELQVSTCIKLWLLDTKSMATISRYMYNTHNSMHKNATITLELGTTLEQDF